MISFYYNAELLLKLLKGIKMEYLEQITMPDKYDID